MMLVAFLPMNWVNTIIIHHTNKVSWYFPDLQDEKFIPFRRCSFSESGKEPVEVFCVNGGGQYLVYECLQPTAT
jgi:hypothetical protein